MAMSKRPIGSSRVNTSLTAARREEPYPCFTLVSITPGRSKKAMTWPSTSAMRKVLSTSEEAYAKALLSPHYLTEPFTSTGISHQAEHILRPRAIPVSRT